MREADASQALAKWLCPRLNECMKKTRTHTHTLMHVRGIYHAIYFVSGSQNNALFCYVTSRVLQICFHGAF